ncbi:hypothetical protein [Mycolicibacter arupensis]|jgi:hypothetical protein|uniref:Transmembrane protein n=1 Tax=Mycolicibacter arupensis TaxID=342002 RepID=A0A0F5MZE0_9MYCO|nr:hypothetical protein [Mycolicibacter arupensis]KKB99969.1 transmembrane protein [Mycolicibacter arupensis]MCV7276654.1 hypothetical protein [Mycolicibacter arupensis]OQZ95560.1 hypothetical protein BST15_14120 [Mycolicibacter arupensis]TXI59397.1 MAG: hypothetical protein E6Q54_03055 [Mycolicibacter arupensis]
MLVIALVLAVVGLAALVFAVVTSNALVAWVCIGASLLGVLLLIVDGLRERRANTRPAQDAVEEADPETAVDGDADGDDESPEPAEVAQFDAEEIEVTAEADDEPAAHPAD